MTSSLQRPGEAASSVCVDKTNEPASGITGDAREWFLRLRPYRNASTARSLCQLGATAIPLITLWVVTMVAVHYGYWWALLLSIPTAGFLVRLFMIQHDCGHRSFFRSRFANDLLGHVIGIFTLTPFIYWRKAHAIHHSTSGNLDHRGIGDLHLLTVREYEALSPLRRILYRLYRNPLVLFGIGPIYLFVVKFRLPMDMLRMRKGTLPSVLVTNIGIAAIVVTLGIFLGFGDFFLVQAPVTLLASAIGTWLFYVQHQFSDTYWARDDSWDFHTAAVAGSTYYVLPHWLRWLTANIGIHHIHHLSSMIPNYRLNECLKDFPELGQVNRLTLWESLKCARLTLWDEATQKLISFRTLSRRRYQAAGT